jgi:hypothetical protein
LGLNGNKTIHESKPPIILDAREIIDKEGITK